MSSRAQRGIYSEFLVAKRATRTITVDPSSLRSSGCKLAALLGMTAFDLLLSPFLRLSRRLRRRVVEDHRLVVIAELHVRGLLHRGDRLFGRVQRHLHRHRTIEQRKV